MCRNVVFMCFVMTWSLPCCELICYSKVTRNLIVKYVIFILLQLILLELNIMNDSDDIFFQHLCIQSFAITEVYELKLN